MVRKSAFLKDILRYLQQSAGRFIGIFAIVALGTFVFAGLGSTGVLMQQIADDYFDTYGLMDVWAVSTYGFNENDLLAISQLEDVAQVEGAYTLDAIAAAPAGNLTVKVESIPLEEAAQINRPELLSGGWPQAPNEVLVEPLLLEKAGLELGDTIQLQSGTQVDIRNLLRTNRYRIVGTVKSPLYFSVMRGSSSVGGGRTDCFVLIPDVNFKQSVYSLAYIAMDGGKQLNSFSDRYFDQVDQLRVSVEAVGEARKPLRREEATRQASQALSRAEADYALAYDQAYRQLDDGQQNLNHMSQQLQQGQAELSHSETEYADSLILLNQQEQTLQSALSEVDTGLSALTSLEQELAQKVQEYKKNRSTLAGAEAELAGNKADALGISTQLESDISQLDTSIKEIVQAFIPLEEVAGQTQAEIAVLAQQIAATSDPGQRAALEVQQTALQEALDDLNRRHTALSITRQQLQSTWEEAIAGQTQLDQGLGQLRRLGVQTATNSLQLQSAKYELDKAAITLQVTKATLLTQREELLQGLQTVDGAKMELEEAGVALQQGRTRLWQSQTVIRAGQAAYDQQRESAIQELNSSAQQITTARQNLQDLRDPKWYVLDRNSNEGFASFDEDSNQVKDLGAVFPMLFFLVAALVSLTTMSRLVEEQRTGMGTLIALGYSSGQLLLKFTLYALVPTFFGALAGGYLGNRFLPIVLIEGAFSGFYDFPAYRSGINGPYFFGGLLLAVCSTTFTTLSACRRELREVPATLMRPRAPQAGKKTPLEHLGFIWTRLSFLYKVTFRNVFRYKKRLFMTLAGVGGSTALIITGLGLFGSINRLVPLQYDELLHYNMQVAFVDGTPDSTIRNVRKQATESGIYRETLAFHEENMDVLGNNGAKAVESSLLVTEEEGLEQFVTLRERDTGRAIPITDTGAVVSEVFCRTFEVGIGDTLTLRNDDDEEYPVVIAAVYEACLISKVYVSPAYYREVFGKPPDHNKFYGILSPGMASADSEPLREHMMNRSAVRSVTDMQAEIDTYNDMLGGMGGISAFVILIAAVLAVVVLTNLTTINITERAREIATIQVLGFRDQEVSAYISRETLVVSFAASLLGSWLGYYLHVFLISVIEGETAMMPKELAPFSYILAIALTMLFAVAVSLLTNRRLHRINMLEALKSNE